MILLT